MAEPERQLWTGRGGLAHARPAGRGKPRDGCQYDYTNLYGVIQPHVERYGISGRATARIGASAEGYVEANFMESTVDYTGFPAVVSANANTGIYFPRFSTSTAANATNAPGSLQLFLPVWVCPELVECETSPNRQLNPNNPFAADGQVARIIGRDMSQLTYSETRSRAYRIAGGIDGTFLDDWTYGVGVTAMHVNLRRYQDGYIYIQHLLDVIADGRYNFANPAATPRDVLDYLTPANINEATSDQVQLQGHVVAPLMDLPGGTLDLALGGSVRYEAVDAPSGNSDINGPTERYFTLNAFGAVGDRTINSGFFEVNAPVLEQVDVNLTGRYDDYSTGHSAFSPKVGVKYTPFDQLTLRATYSEGFRIPSFGEANALPTTGFVANTAALFNDAYLTQYGCSVATFSSCPTYIRSGSYGQTSLASPDLDPEESTSYTFGVILEPLRALRFSVDYYNIEKRGAITSPSNAPALDAYYAGQPIPAGYTVIPDAPDPNFPNATPRAAFVQAQLVNANTIRTEGFDFGATFQHDITEALHLTSSLDVSYIKKLETEFPDGSVERYDGTLGNFNLTAGSGTPKWHGFWVNTFEYGMFEVSGTVNWFGGHNLSAMDQGTGYKDCGLSDGATPCDVDDYFTVDLRGEAQATDNAAVYLAVLNVADEMPPVDVVTYGAIHFNPVQGGAGVLGRYIKAGFKLDF